MIKWDSIRNIKTMISHQERDQTVPDPHILTQNPPKMIWKWWFSGLGYFDPKMMIFGHVFKTKTHILTQIQKLSENHDPSTLSTFWSENDDFRVFWSEMMIFGHLDPKMMLFGHVYKKITNLDPSSKMIRKPWS